MAALPYMQLFVADYLADTAHLNAAQHGAYLLLIMNYWQRGKPLKNCNERLANVARMSNEEWNANKNILAEFFDVTPETWSHKRIETDLRKVESKSTKAKQSRQVAIDNKEKKPRSTNVKRTFNHTDTDTEADTDTEKKVSKINRGSRLALTELPEDWKLFCEEKRPDLSPEEVFSEFRDYWIAVPGQRGCKLDWFATWRNRVRDKKKSHAPPGETSDERYARLAKEMENESKRH